jgi:hypothetical protein
MSNLYDYAKLELERITNDDVDMQRVMNSQILDIVKVFAEQGDSGFSASYKINVLNRLLSFKPLQPLTGEPDEWSEPYDRQGHRQNKRCSTVFANPDGTFDDIDAVIVSDNGGITWFTSGRFRKEITFPYTVPTEPEKIYIEYYGDNDEDYEIITNLPNRIKLLHDRKRAEYDSAEEM